MELDSGRKLESLTADGGMVENDLLMQFQAGSLNRDVIRPLVKETTALGASDAAGLAVGFYKDLGALRRQCCVDRVWKCHREADARERLYAEWKKAVTRSFNWVEERGIAPRA